MDGDDCMTLTLHVYTLVLHRREATLCRIMSVWLVHSNQLCIYEVQYINNITVSVLTYGVAIFWCVYVQLICTHTH